MPPESRQPNVITISAAYGAGGSFVGPRLAERLGVQFVERAIPVAVSARLEVPVDEALVHEHVKDRFIDRVLAHFVTGVQMYAGATPPPEVLPQEGEDFRVATEEVLRDFADQGAVILGRAAAVVLADIPHVLRVRLSGPPEARARQAMRLGGIDRKTAEEQLRSADLSREGYVRHWYQVDATDPSLYHLVLDSTTIELDACVEIIALVHASHNSIISKQIE
jgi:cytidylate kinase